MTISVIGATGNIGSKVVAGLQNSGATVRAIVRDSSKATFPSGVEVVMADLREVDTVRAALSETRTLFLLNAVQPDDVTQALLVLNVAVEVGIERVVYLSVIHSDVYANVPHFAGKNTAERMIQSMGIGATILRPAYFIDNDVTQRDSLLNAGLYTMPIGSLGLAMVHSSDIADVAVVELLRRDSAPAKLPVEVVNVVGPDQITADRVTAIWSNALKRPISYVGDDIRAMELAFRQFAPSWLAYDMSLMAGRFQSDGCCLKAATSNVSNECSTARCDPMRTSLMR